MVIIFRKWQPWFFKMHLMCVPYKQVVRAFYAFQVTSHSICDGEKEIPWCLSFLNMGGGD